MVKYFYKRERRDIMATRKGVIKEVTARSGSFSLVFLLLFGMTFGFLALVGATPDAPGTTKDSDLALNGNDTQVHPPVANSVTPQTSPTPQGSQTQPNQYTSPTPTPTSSGQLPTRILVKKIGLDVTVANPNSTDVDVLDRYLLKGSVRYPTSGLLGQNGTVLLFGHSSYLPIVHNQAYKAFDGIQNLKPGDIISVYSGSEEYQFKVTEVKVADANNDIIELPQDAQHLTLVTCDSFASKSNRYVVTADFAGSYAQR